MWVSPSSTWRFTQQVDSVRQVGGGAQTIELERAAKLLGVSVNALVRRIKRGDLPEAEHAAESADDLWVVPRAALGPIAEREGWIIDLRETDATQTATNITMTTPATESSTDSATAIDLRSDESTMLDDTLETNTAEISTAESDDIFLDQDDSMSSSATRDDGLEQLLERLLTMNTELTDAVVAKEIALKTVEVQGQRLETADTKISELHLVIEKQEAEKSRVIEDLNQATIGLNVAEALAEERAIQIDELHEELDQQRGRHGEELDRHRAQTAELRRRLESTSQAMGWWSKRRLKDRT